MGVKTTNKRKSSSVSNKVSKRAKLVEKKESSPELSESEQEHEPFEVDDLDELDELDHFSDNEGNELDQLNAGEEGDELDHLDQLDNNEEDEDIDTDAPATPVGDPAKNREARALAKEEHAKRKLQRKSGAEVQQIKKLWEKLRCTKPTPSKKERDQLTNDIWSLAESCVLDLVLKHDASRVVQTLVKYGSQDKRDKVVQALKGHFYELATSAYGKYLLIKLLHYGNKQSRALVVDELHGKLRKLMRHKEGAYVVEDLYVLYSSGEQRHQMIREFWGSEYAVFKDSGKGETVVDVIRTSSEKKKLIMANLYGTIAASVAKGSTGFQILHAAMREYMACLCDDIESNQAQIREFIELLHEQIAELIHTSEGSDVACSLIALANAKERKSIVKHLKPHAAQMVKNEHGNLVLITLYQVVDDTKMVSKGFGPELLQGEALADCISDKYGRRPFLYVLRGLDRRFFNPKIQEQLARYTGLANIAGTAKKDADLRWSELQQQQMPVYYRSLVDLGESFAALFAENIAAQFITELLLTPFPVKHDAKAEVARTELLGLVASCAVVGDVREEFHLLNRAPFVSRSLKALIHGNQFKFNNETKKVEPVSEAVVVPGVGIEFAEYVIDTVDIGQWLATTQGAFTLAAALEVLALANSSHVSKLKKELKTHRKELKADVDNKGAKLLLELM
ncbi:pumilio homology domain family member 6 [Diutina catenulata]